MDKEERARHTIEIGIKYQPVTPQRKIALAIYADLSDRRGIKSELAKCDKEVREDMISDWEEIAKIIIRES